MLPINLFAFFPASNCTLSSVAAFQGRKEGRLRLESGEVLYCESGEVLERAAQRGCGCPVLEVFRARLDGALGSLV